MNNVSFISTIQDFYDIAESIGVRIYVEENPSERCIYLYVRGSHERYYEYRKVVLDNAPIALSFEFKKCNWFTMLKMRGIRFYRYRIAR